MSQNSDHVHPPYSGFVLTFEPERTQWLAEKFHLNFEFKESFSAIDWKFEQRELMFLVLDMEPISIYGITLMERMHGSGGSGKRKMRSLGMVVFDEVITNSELPDVNISQVICTPETLRRADSSIWDSLTVEVKQLRPNNADAIDKLISLREEEHRLLGDSPKIASLNEQRDGLGLSLDIARLDRASVMKAMQVDRVETAQSTLDLLDTIPIHERSLLEHDRRIFELLLGVGTSRSAIFSNDSGRSVRIYVVDNTVLETVLGIDLIVYNILYESYLLIQYKRMKRVSYQ